jgi:glycerol uptake facilitator-like aquaporin
MIYAMGNISGGHFNPAVSLGVLFSGREKFSSAMECVYYIAA